MDLTREQADTVRNYVSSLPKEQRGEFMKRYQSLDSEKKGVLVERLLGTIEREETAPNEGGNVGAGLASLAGLGASVAAPAILGQQLNKYITRPSREAGAMQKAYQESVSPIEKQFEQWQSSRPNLVGTRPEDMPKFIGNEISGIKGYADTQKQALNKKFSIAQKKLGQTIKDFDDEVLRSSSDDFALAVQQGHQPWRNEAYSAWENGINDISDDIEKRGINLDASKFNEDVIQKTKQQVLEGGLPESQLSGLADLEGTNIDFKKMRGYVKSQIKHLPKDAQHKIMENFADFIEKNAPEETAKSLSTLNNNYKKFKEIDNAILKYYNPKTGEYDLGKLRQAGVDYAKGKVRTISTELMDVLDEAGIINKPMKGVGEAGSKLKSASAKRAKLVKASKSIAISKEQQIANATKIAKQKIDELVSWKNKAEELISKKKVLSSKLAGELESLADKFPRQKVFSILGKKLTGGLAGFATPAVSPNQIGGSQYQGLYVDPHILPNLKEKTPEQKFKEELMAGLIA